MKITFKLTLLLTVLMSLAGCRYVTGENGLLRNRGGDYTDALILPPMKIPDELDSYTIDQLYVIPEQIASLAAPFDEVPLPKPIEARRSEGVIIQALGSKRWIVIDATPSQVWPLIRDYWFGLQILLDYENPSSGIMETAWVEVDNDFEKRHKYRVSIEPGLHSGYSEIYVTHYENLRTDPIPIVISWPEISNALDLEKEVGDSISQYLADRNDVYQSSTSSLLAGSIEAERKANIVDTSAGETVLELRVDFNRAWIVVRQALENANIEITDSNRDQSFFNVSFSGIVEEDDERGLIGRIFRGRGDDDAAGFLDYSVRLLDTGNVITVKTEALNSSENISKKSIELLRAIIENLS
ncbi:MAG: outer membrane protein assembly factor BamC [Pseudohongiellaceae bacterium]|jgi:outer membrane protein assembly factor BamC